MYFGGDLPIYLYLFSLVWCHVILMFLFIINMKLNVTKIKWSFIYCSLFYYYSLLQHCFWISNVDPGKNHPDLHNSHCFIFALFWHSGCNENDADHLDRDQQPYPPSQKTKRMRTSFKHHQLRTMKSYFAINHNPDAKDLKQLAQKTGLTKRVLQVSVATQ